MEKKSYSGTYAYKTDQGRVRKNNEDQALVLTNGEGEVLLVVCDGMGGANKGDLASDTAVSLIKHEFEEKKSTDNKSKNRRWIVKVIRKANNDIYNKSQEIPGASGMGTTVVLALLVKDTLYLASLGDSRAYLDNSASIRQISEDQTYARFLEKTGQISHEEALSHPERHVLMNALGIFPSLALTVDILPYEGEKILLCTDGLYNQVADETIHAILSTDERADQKVSTLIGTANAAGGSDNSGIAYWECIDD